MPQPQSQMPFVFFAASHVQSSADGSRSHDIHAPLTAKHASHESAMQPGWAQLYCVQSMSGALQPQSQ